MILIYVKTVITLREIKTLVYFKMLHWSDPFNLCFSGIHM